uniref:Uncharacterized protein n=1 Tax=Tetranychus urticae TaxID=32264 RepID=T1JWP8_TETUR
MKGFHKNGQWSKEKRQVTWNNKELWNVLFAMKETKWSHGNSVNDTQIRFT